jgi:2-polyprenyl-6-methoxyphenol hydroxylase-like FAD-dependent oxidoreductase
VNQKNGHAIVIGGSMAGICAARVLSESFAKVTVVDRDAYPDGARERPGVPQSRHVHALLMRGRIELDALFPGFERTMLDRGALEVNFGRDFAVLRRDGWALRRPNPITTIFASRALIETTTRELLRRIPNVELVERVEAAGFEVAPNGALKITGIKVRPRDGRPEYSLAGDLIVDASGRTTKCPAWLAELGVSMPDEEVVDSHTGYASRWYRAHPERRPRDWWWKGVWIEPAGDESAEAGVIFPVENGGFIATLAGWNSNYPPSEEAAFTAKLRALRSPLIAEEAALAEPVSPVYSYRQMANRWRHFERWNARIAGFIALGDATCAFNPVYGQGMTSGALAALILRDCLQKFDARDPEFPAQVFARLAKFQADPWGLATGADFAFAGTEGKRPFASRVIQPVLGKMFEVQNDDPAIAGRIGEVINMIKPPGSLFEPRILMRLARAWGRRLIHGKPAPLPMTPMPPLAGATEPARDAA